MYECCVYIFYWLKFSTVGPYGNYPLTVCGIIRCTHTLVIAIQKAIYYDKNRKGNDDDTRHEVLVFSSWESQDLTSAERLLIRWWTV